MMAYWIAKKNTNLKYKFKLFLRFLEENGRKWAVLKMGQNSMKIMIPFNLLVGFAVFLTELLGDAKLLGAGELLRNGELLNSLAMSNSLRLRTQAN